MKIKEIKKFNIEVSKNNEVIYSGISDNASDDIKNSDIINVEMFEKCLKISI